MIRQGEHTGLILLAAILVMIAGCSVTALAEATNTAEADTWTNLSVSSKGEIKVDDGSDVWIKAVDIVNLKDNLNVLGADHKETRKRVRGNIAAEYSNLKGYNVGEYVLYQGELYRCTTKITLSEDWVSGHWKKISLGEVCKGLSEEADDLYDNVSRIDGNLNDTRASLNQVLNTYAGWQ